jgi:predicted Zn-dependent protease
MQLGRQEYGKTLRENRSRIVSSGRQYVGVQRVAKRIEAVAGRDKPAFVWKVTLIRKNVANAYCLPGGKIVVYTGILPLAEEDAGLATVLGHEVAHATAEHVAERIERNHLTEVAATALAFWKRMQRASQGREPPEFLSDHPSDAHRVARVRGWLPEAERAYRPHT